MSCGLTRKTRSCGGANQIFNVAGGNIRGCSGPLLRLLHEAADVYRPRIRLQGVRIARWVFFVRAELVEVVVRGDLLVRVQLVLLSPTRVHCNVAR